VSHATALAQPAQELVIRNVLPVKQQPLLLLPTSMLVRALVVTLSVWPHAKPTIPPPSEMRPISHANPALKAVLLVIVLVTARLVIPTVGKSTSIVRFLIIMTKINLS